VGRVEFHSIGNRKVTVLVAEPTGRENSLIVEGRYMRCPRCRDLHDILRYVPMGQVEEFRAETNPIYKCPNCRWIFSPRMTLEEMREFFDE